MTPGVDGWRVAGWTAAWRLARVLPEGVGRVAVRVAADRAWRRRGPAVRQLERNLARVTGRTAGCPETRQVSREALRSYARYWLEVFRLADLTRDEVLGRATVDGWDRVTAAVRERGAVVALPHMGNWDLAGAWSAANDVPVTAVAERLHPAALYERFVEARHRVGIEVVPLDDRDVMDTLVRRATEHRLVTLLADRAFGGGGVDVQLFGATARMPGGAATVALRAGVPLFPVTLWYEDVARVRVHEQVRVPAVGDEHAQVASMTRSLGQVFEEAIRSHPSAWHMLQRVWLADRAAGQADAGSAARCG